MGFGDFAAGTKQTMRKKWQKNTKTFGESDMRFDNPKNLKIKLNILVKLEFEFDNFERVAFARRENYL